MKKDFWGSKFIGGEDIKDNDLDVKTFDTNEDNTNISSLEIDEREIEDDLGEDLVKSRAYFGGMISKKTAVLALVILITILLFIFIFMVNQIYIFSNLISFGNNTAASVIFVILLIVFITLFMFPLIGFFRYKKVDNTISKYEPEIYLRKLEELKNQLRKNKYLRKRNYEWKDGELLEVQIADAYACLGLEADRLIRKEANSVFFSTAISQNGSLDALFVFCSIIKMIYKITVLYQGRPSIANICRLYTNIAMTLLLTRGIEDLNIIEDQVEAIVSTLIGGTFISMIPGSTVVTNIIMTSIIEGSINSFLTLRVGVMTKRFLASLVPTSKKMVRRQASIEASSMLFSLMKENVVAVIKTFSKKITKYPRRLWQK